MDYQNYGITDFILDESFFQWVTQPDARLDKFWEEWLERHPHKQEEIEEARWLILNIRKFLKNKKLRENPSAVSNAEIQHLISRINNTLELPDTLSGQTSQNNEEKR